LLLGMTIWFEGTTEYLYEILGLRMMFKLYCYAKEYHTI